MMSILKRIAEINTKSSNSESGLLQNIRPNYILENLKLAYLPDMPLDEYIKIFSRERRKRLRTMLKEIVQSGKSGDDYTYEINEAIQDIEETSRRKGRRAISMVSSLVRSNALTLTGLFAGSLSQNAYMALVGLTLGTIAKFNIPKEINEELNRVISDKIAVPLSAMLKRKSPNLIHIIQLQREIKKLTHN